MTLLQSFLLGIIQGLTEFIPVSSTAHLLIGQRLLGIPADDAMFSFLVIVHLGTIISLLAFYWKDLLAIVKATLDFRSLKDFGSLDEYRRMRRRIQCLAHGSNMLWGRAATPANNDCAALAERKRVIAEVIGISGIHDAPAHLLGPARVWFHPKLAIRNGLLHLLQDSQQLCRSA